ncbi:MAG TPA: sulfite exporter TauE/SafE family protein, partial [Gaiellaceae bacterium]|nr:sulfite exporter TauE/SafE family protein [Gaiellaceae bacterium]
MKRLVLAVVAVAALAVPAAAAAHPLGNFTVNRFSAVELSGSDVYVHYVLDLAEIPTYQEGDRVRAPAFSREIAARLVLELDGRRVALLPMQRKLSEKPGAGGLPTLRFEAVFRAADLPNGSTGPASLVFHDTNFADRIGWKEVVVRAERGASITSSTASAESASDELRAYPKDLLRSPLDITSARVTYSPGAAAGVPPALDGGAAPNRARGGFESLVARGRLSVGVVLLAFLVAAFWGAAHALTPGHGKAIVAGYLVGSRGKPRHAVLLGAVVTVTHTAGVFALGLVTLLLSRFVVPERLYPWLTVVSGLLVVVVGASVFWRRWRHGRAHAHGHSHSHEHAHETRGLLGVGIAAGLLPCPSALVVLLSAIAL